MNPAETLTLQDGKDIAIILLPLAFLLIGGAIMTVATRMGFFVLYREHLEKHSFAEKGRHDCPFCKEERASFQCDRIRDVGALTSNPDGKLQ